VNERISGEVGDPMSKYTGSDFDEFLKDEGILEEVAARAHKRLLALQLSDAMKASNTSKAQLAERLQTSRSQVDRLLDPDNTAVTLESLERLAQAVGKQLRVELA
jgi:antitoxin HicB